MHIVKSSDRYLGFVNSQVDAVRFADVEDANVVAGAMLVAQHKGGDPVEDVRPILLTTRAMRAERDAINAANAAESTPPAPLSGSVDVAIADLRVAFADAIDRLAALVHAAR